ncbi:hypothetical protein KI688_002010 [Linnemannia hyalina]|uniref:Uncharacterized protein n=1 Tax=Linnemannia hyalina TaxID=64524 RepID=A0A9P7XRB6_9FUNG|nr:hypothetical protein KI688_002010 [Linnemannia hyalina]
MYSPSRPTSTSPSTPSSGRSHTGTAAASRHQSLLHSTHSHQQQQQKQQQQQQQQQQLAMPGELRQAHHLPLEQLQQPLPPPPPVPQFQTLPVLNSINRVSRTYYSKHDQGVVYMARTPGVSLHRQTDMRRESCEIIAAIGKRIGL